MKLQSFVLEPHFSGMDRVLVGITYIFNLAILDRRLQGYKLMHNRDSLSLLQLRAI